MSAAESIQSRTVQQESCSNGFLALQEAAKLDVAKLAGPGGATYLLIYLEGLQTSLEATDNVGPTRCGQLMLVQDSRLISLNVAILQLTASGRLACRRQFKGYTTKPMGTSHSR